MVYKCFKIIENVLMLKWSVTYLMLHYTHRFHTSTLIWYQSISVKILNG